MRKNSKKMQLEVDQSVRIEEIHRDTVIGVANKEIGVGMILPRKVKRHFREDFRRQGKPRYFPPLLFAAATVAVLRKSSLYPTLLVVDSEYSSYENLIIGFLNSFYPAAVISIHPVGKNSPAHAAAYLTHRGRRSSDGTITLADLHAVFSKLKTTGEWHHLEFTRIRQPNRSVRKKYRRKK